MKTWIYKPKGVCSTRMEFEMDVEIIRAVKVDGGCSGNLQGICSILRDKTIDEVISAFNGIHCGFKKTSCPDQIAKALKEYREQNV